MLGQEYKTSVEFLNQFVRSDYQIYVSKILIYNTLTLFSFNDLSIMFTLTN